MQTLQMAGWNGNTHKICNLILLSDILISCHESKERLEKDNGKWKSPTPILTIQIETRMASGKDSIAETCQVS